MTPIRRLDSTSPGFADALERLTAFEESLDLVTASAFFDLVSEEWIARFCQELAARQLPLYTVLTYDGTETWSPPHDHDAPMLAAFHAHQGRDKGFGWAKRPICPHSLPHLLCAWIHMRVAPQRSHRRSLAALRGPSEDLPDRVTRNSVVRDYKRDTYNGMGSGFSARSKSR